MINVDLSAKIWKNIMCANPATCTCKNGEHLESIIGDSVTTCEKVIEATKTVPTKTATTKTVLTKRTSTNFFLSLIFLWITIALLIAFSIYFCLIKYRSKQKHSLPYHDTSNKKKEINFNYIIQNRVMNSNKQT